MSAVSILELDTTGPQFTFGKSYIDSDLNLRIPFEIDEPVVYMTVWLETSLGNFEGIVIDDEFMFEIPLDEVDSIAAIGIQAIDDVGNLAEILFGVALWSGAAKLSIKVFADPNVSLKLFEQPSVTLREIT